MTLVAAALYPHILEEEYIGTPKAILMISDSRIANLFTYKAFDVAQKIHQLSNDCFIGYAGNVKFAQEVIKSLEYTLQVKKKLFNGHKSFVQRVTETIGIKKEKLGDGYDTDFLLTLINDENYPEMYFYSEIFRDNYQEHLVSLDNKIKIIGQDARERNLLEELIYKAIDEFNAKDILQCSIAMRKAMRDYIETTANTKIGKYVGGLIQGMSIEPHPVGVEMLNSAIFDCSTGTLLEITQFDQEQQRWILNVNGQHFGTTYKYPLDQI